MSMFVTLHKVYNDCFEDGVFSRVKATENKLLDEDYEFEFRANMLEKIFDLVLHSKVMNELAYEYITNGHRTYEDCVKLWNKEHVGEEIKLSSGKNKIIYTARNINDNFIDINYDGIDYNIIEWLCEKKFFMGLENSAKKIDFRNEFTKQFNLFNEKFGESLDINKRDIMLNIPTYEKVDNITDEEFEQLLEVMRPYSKYIANKAQTVLDSMEKEVGYFRFLMGKRSKLTELDIERKNVILRWLGKEVVDLEDKMTSIEEIDNTSDDDIID